MNNKFKKLLLASSISAICFSVQAQDNLQNPLVTETKVIEQSTKTEAPMQKDDLSKVQKKVVKINEMPLDGQMSVDPNKISDDALKTLSEQDKAFLNYEDHSKDNGQKVLGPVKEAPAITAAQAEDPNKVTLTKAQLEFIGKNLPGSTQDRVKDKQKINDLERELKTLQTQVKSLKESQAVIPSVPAKVLTKNVPSYKAGNNRTVKAGNNEVVVTPGVNQILQIAIGHTNRIVTPFNHPQVSSSVLTGGPDGEVKIKDNVVYVSTSKDYPLSMFITEKGQENVSISLTLLPKKIPSRELVISLNNANLQMRYGSEEAETWEKSQPYVTAIKKTLKEIALQKIPSGYQLSDIPRDYPVPHCSINGFKVDFKKGQLIAGSKLHYVVGKVTNTSKQTLEFKEQSCADYDTAAVALFPLTMFEPGQSSEIYVVKRAPGKQELQQVRKSVLAK